MEMAGERRIAASPQRVWEALNDPSVLRACIPGCQSLEKEADDRLSAVAEIKIGPIGARFKGAVTLGDLDPPHGYTISGQGSGGVAGNAKGMARVRLSPDGAGTLLAYNVEAQVGGRMAQLGGPLIDATAKNLAEKFFSTFGALVAGEADAAPAATQSATASVAVVESSTPVRRVQTSAFPWPWAIATGIAIIAGFLLGRSEVADWWVVAVVILALAAAGAGYEAGRRGGDRA